MSDGYTEALLRDYQREQVSQQRTIEQQQTTIDELRVEVLSLTKKLAACRKYWEQND
jgi:hypothetical protein